MSGGVVTVDVAELIAIYRTAGALHDLVYAHPADVDPHAANMAARGLSLALQRRLRDLQTGPVVRAPSELPCVIAQSQSTHWGHAGSGGARNAQSRHMSTAAASLPIDLSGAIHEGLRQIDVSARAAIQWADANFVAPTAGKFQKAAAHIQMRLVANKATRFVSRNTSDTLETLIWLRGMKATIEDSGSDDLGAEVGALLAEVESLQDRMQRLRASIVRLKDSVADATKSPTMRAQRVAAFHRYLAALSDAYAALDAARWAILEREADADVAAGRIGQTFTNAADLLASLGD